MSRCRACNRIMKQIDYMPLEEGGPEEDICMCCRQEIFKHTPWEATVEQVEDKKVITRIHRPNIDLGLTEDEMEEGFFEGIYVDYRGGRFDQ